MVRLKNRNESPIGGFMFIDAPIDPNPLQDWGFTQIVNTVINRRLQNPRFGLSTDFQTVADQVDEQNAQRMLRIRGGVIYTVDDGGGGDPAPFPPAHRSGLRNVAAKGENILTGSQVLKDWIGDGGVPVSSDLANARAAVCKVCPQNGGGDWTTYFTAPASAIIRRQLAQKEGLELTTTEDANLGVCKACSCPLKLKVHVPLAHILARMRDEVKTQLVPQCWMLTEKP